MSYVLGILAFIVWGYFLLFKNKYAPLACMVFIVSDYWFGVSASFTTGTKFLISFTIMIAFVKCPLKSRLRQYWPLVLLFILQIITFYSNENGQYTFNSFITSFFNIVLGLSCFLVVWEEDVREKGFVLLAWSSLICVILGILQKGVLFSDDRIVSGTWLPHTPGSLAVIGMMACIVLRERYDKKIYVYVFYMNFLLVAAAQVRGMLIFACILCIPDIYFMIKILSRKRLFLLCLIVVAAIVVLPNFVKPLLERTFTGDGEINSSGRLEAWPYFIELSKNNRILGMGIGRVKTFTDSALVNFPSCHNEYLRFLVETGVIGIILMASQFYIVLKNTWRNCVLNDKRFYLTFFYIAFGVLAFVENVVTGHLFWFPFCLLLSLLRVQDMQQIDEEKSLDED